MTDFLLELRSEEIPARMQDRAREDLARLFAAELAKAGLAAKETVTYATPRRLALIARGLPDETAATREETKGPKEAAPPQALEGFLRKSGLAREQLVERDGVLFAVIDRPGRATADVLAAAIPEIVRAFPWPKAMRWGAASTTMESPRWVRPLQGIVALFGGDIVACEVAGIVSSATTLGHCFHHPGTIKLGGADDYVEKLRACHVIVDQAERRQIIALGATMAARKAGLELVQDEGLLTENAGLTEWPLPLLGRFDAAFLEVPPEVIQLTARVNQKYFVCRDADGALANAFVCTANIDASDGGAAIVEGNRKVLAARLADAKFFYDTDLKVPLEEQAQKLDRIVFHEKLGTVADKVERVAKLARWLVEEGIVKSSPGRGGGPPAPSAGGGGGVPQATVSPVDPPLHHLPEEENGSPPRAGEEQQKLAALAERAARLCKADLVTGMVGEFPELQGVMGGYYALAQGEHPAVAAAIRDHYKPVGQGDDVPTEPVTVAVSLADKLDSLFEFFALDQRPSGSRDPFALRRSALGCLALLETNAIGLGLERWFEVQASLSLWSVFAREQDKVINDRIKMLGDNPARWQVAQASIKVVPTWYGTIATDFGQLETMTGEAISIAGDELSAVAAAAIDAHVAGAVQQFDNLKIFFADRLKVQQREAGVRHDLIDAVFALGGEDDLVRLLARVHALQAFVGTPDGANLLAGYKRAANILKKEGWSPSDQTRHPGPFGEAQDRLEPGPIAPQAADGQEEGWAPAQGRGDDVPQKSLSYTPEPAEEALIAALDSAEPAAASAVAREDFGAAMAALATLRAPIDRFFESVIVNDPNADKRAARLGLLSRVRNAVHTVADFSRIEG